MRYLFFLLAPLMVLAASSRADEMVEVAKEYSLGSGNVNEWKIAVPPFSIEHQVRLSLEARVDWPALAGSNPWMRVAVNGTFLTKPDLLNKRDDFKMRSGLDLTWVRGDTWRVIYSPDYEIAKTSPEPMAIPDTEPYRFVWDITRYVHPGENKLQIIHLPVLSKPTKLVLHDVKVEVGAPISPPAEDAIVPAPTGPLPDFLARSTRKVPMQVALAPTGGIALSVAGQNFQVSTRTSLPGGQWLETPASTLNGTANKQTQSATWQSENYKIKREVSVRDDHLHVADTLTNITPKLIGVMIENRLNYSRRPDGKMMAGWPVLNESHTARNPCHPSVFAQWKELGVGLVAEDDIFRIHIKSVCEPNYIGLADDQLGLAPGASTTLEWSIYPLPKKEENSADYWDFINTVRRNWGSNYEIPGPFVFTMHLDSTKPAAELGQWMRARDLKIVAGGIATYANGKYAHGTGILFAPEFVAQEKEWIGKVHQAAPGIKALCYFHAQISTEPDAETKYVADRLYDEKGEPMSYPYRYPLPMFLPTRESVYGKALWGYVHAILDDIHADGLYWDEMSHGVLEYANQAPWDGHTVVIDRKTHEVRSQRSSVPLLMQPLKLDIIKYVRDHGKYLMGNSQPMTRTMLQQKVVRFVETGTYAALINTRFGCPLGLGNHHREATPADVTRNVRLILQQGGVYYGHLYDRDPATWNFTSVMYPITPARLGPGFVIGKERIHTTVSGRFGWPDGAAADVYVVNADGTRVAKPNVKEVSENSRRLYEIRIASDQFAVLVKH